MAVEYWGESWLNLNSLRSYPISESATLKDISDSVKLPDDFLVDLTITAHSSGNYLPTRFHVLHIGVFGTAVTVSFAYSGTMIGSISISVSGFVRNSVYTFYGSGDFHDTVGSVTVGSLDNLLTEMAGLVEFDTTGARLEPSVIRYDTRGVTSIKLDNAGAISAAIQGIVQMMPGTNMKITADVSGATPIIRFDAISGENLNESCECDEAQELLDPIRTINGIGPDENGDFILEGSDCIQLTPITNGINMNDACSEPCCDCEELNIINEELKRIRDQVYSLEFFASEISAAVDQLRNVILSVKLGTYGS